jgi:hypothetical protein
MSITHPINYKLMTTDKYTNINPQQNCKEWAIDRIFHAIYRFIYRIFETRPKSVCKNKLWIHHTQK